MWWYDDPNGWDLLWMGLMMMLFWLPFIALVIWGVRGFATPGTRGDSAPPPDARQIARAAYARGELDRERFLEIIEDLDRTEER